MSNEIFAASTSGQTLYVVALSAAGTYVNATGPVLEAYSGANWTSAKYCQALTDANTIGHYLGTFPAVAAGRYRLLLYKQLGGSPAATDTKLDNKVVEWTGTQLLSTAVALPNNVAAGANGGLALVVGANGAARNTYPIVKNQAFTNFAFTMTDSALHALKPGLTVTPSRDICDGNGYQPLNNIGVTDRGSGVYSVNLAASDLNSNTVILKFSAPGADDSIVITFPQA